MLNPCVVNPIFLQLLRSYYADRWMSWFQKDPHKVDNSFFSRWQEGPSLVEARSAHTSFVTSQVGRWSCASCALHTMNNDHLLPTPGLDTSFVSYLHNIHQGILLVGGGDSPSTAELVRYNQAMMILVNCPTRQSLLLSIGSLHWLSRFPNPDNKEI